LSLLSYAVAQRPVLCVIDDFQWWDRSSRQAMAFAARRLLAESMALVFATRQPSKELEGLPNLLVEGLSDADARDLLTSVLRWPVDEQVRDRIIAETRGNPLALVELTRGLTPAELAGGFALPNHDEPLGRLELDFRSRAESLPPQSHSLLLLAAAEPLGSPELLWRAARRLGIEVSAASPASDSGLIEFGSRVRFRHPLVRSVVYRSASDRERRTAHRALAEATDPRVDPDRRAWHFASATVGIDDAVAAELERCAERAQDRGGIAAAAAFLERSASLTGGPGRRAGRTLAAAHAKCQVGAFDVALDLVAAAEVGGLDGIHRARADLIRGRIAFASSRGREAPKLLLTAAQELLSLDLCLARETLLEALSAGLFAGRLAGGRGAVEIAETALSAPPLSMSSPAWDQLLDGLALVITGRYVAGVPVIKDALRAFRFQTLTSQETLRWLWLACHAAVVVWDDDTWHALATLQVQVARDAGALAVLPVALNSLAFVHLFGGDFASATALVDEAEAVGDAIGNRLPPYAALPLAACRGREAEVVDLVDTTVRESLLRGEGMGLASAYFNRALLYNCSARYSEALADATQASAHPEELWSTLALPELIEASVRSGQPTRAASAIEQLSANANASGTDWALGILARSHALVSADDTADEHYQAAIEHLGRTRVRIELARTHLLYGEWLRRQRRKRDARIQLRRAFDIVDAAGADSLAERARTELRASGEHVRRRSVDTPDDMMTARELQIAVLAMQGASNSEIAARLFISSSTVAYHLRKVFTKLAISSRNQLQGALVRERGRYQQLQSELGEDFSSTAAQRR